MANQDLSDADVVRIGRRIYEEQIGQRLGQAENGRFAVIDVQSGDFELADTAIEALDRLQQRHPDALAYIHRIGRAAAYRIGARVRTAS